jgi:TolB-like protein/Tfp pilus assembly protein PilF
MPDKSDNKFQFWKELKRRRVFKVVAMYAAAAFVIIELSNNIVEPLNLPSWTPTMLIVLLIIGFPFAVIFSWIFDITPKGIKKTENIDADIKSIAVLPLINLSNEDDNLEYFSDGVTQEIIDELAKIKSFTITAFSTTYQYKGKDKSRAEIAKELEVKYLIQGSAKVYKDSVWLSIELFNPSTNERVWNGKYNEVLDNAPSLQVSIAKQVAHSLDIKLSSAEIESLGKNNTIEGEAFKLFLHAKAEISKLNEEGFINSINFINKALEIDPNYTQAHTLLAWNYLLGGAPWIKANNRSAKENIDLANPHIEKAIELNPKSSDIYLVRGNLHMHYTGFLYEAKKDIEHALELNSWPKIPINYCICTVVSTYIALGEYTRAKELSILAKKIDPGNVLILYSESILLMIDGQYKKAQDILKLAEDNFDIPFFNFHLGLSYYHDNKYEEAIDHLEKALDAKGKLIARSLAYLSNAHYKLNNLDESERYRKDLERRLDLGEHYINLPKAIISAARNERLNTLKWLEKAQDNMEWGLAVITMFDPIFKPFMNETRFVKIRKKMLNKE